MRVLFLTYNLAPYRIAFFNGLGEHCDLTVAFEEQFSKNRNRAWFSESVGSFTPVYMKGKKIGQEMLCPEIISLIKQKFDVIIIGGYASPTAMLAIAYMKCHRIPFYLEVDGGLIRGDSKPKYLLKKMLVGAANGWFSSGKTTTEYLLHYGAK